VVLPPRPWHRRNVCSMALLVQLRLQDWSIYTHRIHVWYIC
jgi:hypothetical protein